MNRPIFIIVIGYIIGIIWGLYLQRSIVPFYFILLMIYIIIKLPYRKKKFKIFSIKRYFRYIKLIFKLNIILTIIISSLISNIIIKYKNSKYDNLYKGIENLEVTGIVVSNKVEKEYYNRYKIKVLDGKFKNTYLYINSKEELEYGDKIDVNGEFIEPSKARNYKGFDYKEYLKTLKIYGTIKVKNIKVLEKNKANIVMQISNRVFLKIKYTIKSTYSGKIAKIIMGVMLGYTDEIDAETKQDFSNSNISHVLAVSGMHISYIIILVTNSTKKIFGKKQSKIIASVVLLIYMFITGFSISVVRASIMGILSCMAFIVYRKSDTLNNISISALIILINNPYNLTSLSFLLTYGGTLGIIYFEPIIERVLKSIKIRNRKWKYVFLKIQRKCKNIIEVISVSISAQVIITPIMAMNFNSIGIGFILTNLMLSYIIGIVVMGGFVQILISIISINAGMAIAKIIEIPVYGILLISKISFGNFKIVTPDLYQVIGYYIVVYLLRFLYQIFHSKNCNPTQKRVKNTIYLVRYKLRPYFSKIMIVFLIMILLVGGLKKIPHDLNVYFIDVGQGDSTLIVTPNNKKILIDGGGSKTYDVGKNVLEPYLFDRKIKKIDYAIISHYDQDHCDGVLYILQNIKVENVIIGRQIKDSDNYNKFIKIIKEKSINVHVVSAGERLNIEKNLYFDILWPDMENKINENVLNNNSLICKLVYKDFSMLFTGDIEEIAEKTILKKYKGSKLLKSTILKVAHHGSKTSSSKEFISAVQPQIALIGVGSNNKFGHPSNVTIENLKNINCKIYRTDKDGEISIKVDNNKIVIFKKLECIKSTILVNN